MSKTVIAAYDGSAASRTAVQFAVALADAQDAEVSAVHVYPRVPPAVMRSGAPHPGLQATMRDEAAEVLEALDVEGVAHRLLLAGSPAQVLHELAEDEHASLLVVGATHHGAAGRLFPGSVPSKLLHGAPCPVLVVPADRAPGPISAIVAAYDESPQAEHALREATHLASLYRARLTIVAVHEPHLYAGPAMVASTDLDDVLRGDLAQRVRERADAITGVDVTVDTAMGDAKRVIIRAAQDADLLVTGSRGYGPLHSVLVGSMSRHLVDHAACPVLVLPRVPDRVEPTTETPAATAQAA
jgi:nucleotide-binding universal stress UspA family protein